MFGVSKMTAGPPATHCSIYNSVAVYNTAQELEGKIAASTASLDARLDSRWTRTLARARGQSPARGDCPRFFVPDSFRFQAGSPKVPASRQNSPRRASDVRLLSAYLLRRLPTVVGRSALREFHVFAQRMSRAIFRGGRPEELAGFDHAVANLGHHLLIARVLVVQS